MRAFIWSADRLPNGNYGDCSIPSEDLIPVRKGRIVVQGMSVDYLLSVFLDVYRDPPEIVTCYKASKICNASLGIGIFMFPS